MYTLILWILNKFCVKTEVKNEKKWEQKDMFLDVFVN